MEEAEIVVSVQQVKDRVEELATYLGRDATGLEKLRKLKDAVNVLRSRLATAEEKESRATELRDIATSRLTSSEVELSTLRIENHRLQQVVDNLTRELDAATTPDPSGDDEGEQPTLPTEAEYKAVMKSLWKLGRECPPGRKPQTTIDETPRAYNRNELAAGWSHQAIWQLGAAVAVLCGFSGSVTVQTKDLLAKSRVRTGEPNSADRLFLRWWTPNNMKFDRDSVQTAIHESKYGGDSVDPCRPDFEQY